MNKLNLCLIGSAFLLGSLATSAEAVVIYNWYDVSSDPQFGPISASIALDESVFSLGGTFVYDSRQFPGAESPLAYFGVASVDFATPLNWSSTPSAWQGFSDPIKLTQTTCGQDQSRTIDPVASCSSYGMAIDDVVVSRGYWEFDLQFGEFLQGSMYLNDLWTDVRMSSQGPLFTIEHLGSDSYGPCKSSTACAGGTGYWRLDHSTMPVSEPSAVLLFAAGLCSLVATQRRRASKRRAALI